MIPESVIEEGVASGRLDILNVTDGDTTLTFDPNKPEDIARAKTVIKDMLRLGYSIFVEIDNNGTKELKRVKRFSSKRTTYIITDRPTNGGKPTEREVPVAGTKATAVGRTAGG